MKQKQRLYTLIYKIPQKNQTRQRGNSQKLKNLTKDDARNWTQWLKIRKIGATYSLTIQ